MLALPKPTLDPGLRLRQVRERLGLTYRDVERASYSVSEQHARSEFILHISRLSDIENRGVVPGIHKLYSLATIYHLNPMEICKWYEVPFTDHFCDGCAISAPKTHVAAPPMAFRVPLRFDPAFDPRSTAYLSRMIEQWGNLEGALFGSHSRYRYGYVGLEDRHMDPFLRPGSLVQVDPALRTIRNHGWGNEFERPIFLVDVRTGYRCCWFTLDGTRLVLQPYPLSPCLPEVWRLPVEAEVVGQVVGIVTRLASR